MIRVGPWHWIALLAFVLIAYFRIWRNIARQLQQPRTGTFDV